MINIFADAKKFNGCFGCSLELDIGAGLVSSNGGGLVCSPNG